MNPGYSPEAYPAETVGLQDRRQDGFPGQPGGPRFAQHTPDPLKDHLVWSLWNFVYGNCFCLGLTALIFSIKSRDRKVVGDQDGARRYASTAHILNIVATILASIAVFIFFVVLIAVSVQFRRL
ncbi:dispanin subfamily A member 2b-like [Poecilia reticulata]|nr:PREDICTED: dispanin subfamily A member 2b-like [Poecilia reticulata]